MTGKVLNIKACSPLKPHHGLTGQHHEICHYSYNLPLAFIVKRQSDTTISSHQDCPVTDIKTKQIRQLWKIK